MLHRGAQVERGVREQELLVHLVREGSRLDGGQIAPDAPSTIVGHSAVAKFTR